MSQPEKIKAPLEFLRRVAGGLELRLHVQPGSSKTGFAGLHGNRLKARIRARAVEGQANEALQALVAKTVGVAKSQVCLVRGDFARDKDIRILWPEHTPDREIEQAAEMLCKSSGIKGEGE